MITGKKTCVTSAGKLLALSLAAAFHIGNVVAESVPVEESVPMGTTINAQPEVQSISETPVTLSSPVSNEPVSADNSTAFLLNRINQLQQELMEVRGLLEEQSFIIDKLQQESRDRYVDLDDRISRLIQGNGKPTHTPLTTSSVTTKTPVLPAVLQPTANVNETVSKEEEKTYQAAFSLIRAKKFDDAKDALKKQLVTYPTGRFADNAHYWLGEVEMAQGHYDKALAAFEVVLKSFPKSSKVPDASYKVGRIYDLKGERNQSRTMLERVIKQYPDSAAARLSDTYLRAMGDS